MPLPRHTKLNTGRRGQTFIALLIVLVIIGLMWWVLTKNRKPEAGQDSYLKDAGVDTSNYKTIIDSARKVAADASKPRE